ncbi:MAG TPA: hypothetical protein VG244_06525 [Acidimicrobiales bacterium]|jgi:hypothetical protein|nr:hypothetical protein [Acidimicrobiales bacterium]
MTYLDRIADEIRKAVRTDALPDEETVELFRLYAVLLLSKGQAVTAEDVHNAWVAWMLSKGEAHESLVPFAELNAKTQGEDSPFVLAIRSVARDRAERTSQNQ